MDKYIVKPSRIIDEKGYVSSIDDYLEHNLPCGGSSGSTNNDSIVNELMNLDARVETLEEKIKNNGSTGASGSSSEINNRVETLENTLNFQTFDFPFYDTITGQYNEFTQSNTNTIFADREFRTVETVMNAIDQLTMQSINNRQVIENNQSRIGKIEMLNKIVTIDDVLNTEFDYTGYEGNPSGEVVEKNRRTSIKSWIIEFEYATVYLSALLVVQLMEPIQTFMDLSKHKEEYYDVDMNYEIITGQQYTLANMPIYFFISRLGEMKDLYLFGNNVSNDKPEGFSVMDSIHKLICMHNASVKDFEYFYNNDVKTMKEQISQLATYVAEAQSAVATMTTGGDDLIVIDQQISTLSNRVTLLENNTTNNTTKIGVNTTDIAALLNRIVDLETTVQAQAQLISEMKSKLDSL